MIKQNKLTLIITSIIILLPMLAGVISMPIANYWLPESLFAMAVSNIGFMAFGGSSLMIVVGVALETTRDLEAQMSLRNYKGFLDD